MRVKVSLLVDVDPATWAASNGRLLDADNKFQLSEVREDIRSFFLTLAQGTSMTEETEAEITLSR